MDAKKALAGEIVRQYHGENEAKAAWEDFERKFQKQDPFTGLVPIEIKAGSAPDMLVSDTALSIKAVSSKGEFRRLVEQGAVEVQGIKIDDFQYRISLGEYTIKIGKTKFYRVTVKK
jgi:tyrosyl-tRNA synthetase